MSNFSIIVYHHFYHHPIIATKITQLNNVVTTQ